MKKSYEIKIVPEKEKKLAQINIILKSSTWPELNSIYMKIIKGLPSDQVLKREIYRNNTLFIEIQYESLEGITQKIVSILAAEPDLELSKKQIFIKKLGGWFDF